MYILSNVKPLQFQNLHFSMNEGRLRGSENKHRVQYIYS